MAVIEPVYERPLAKARAALQHARDLKPSERDYGVLVEIASLQTQIAQAEALERIAAALEILTPPATSDPRACPACNNGHHVYCRGPCGCTAEWHKL